MTVVGKKKLRTDEIIAKTGLSRSSQRKTEVILDSTIDKESISLSNVNGIKPITMDNIQTPMITRDIRLRVTNSL